MTVFDFANTSVEHVYPRNANTIDPNLEDLKDTLGNLTFLDPHENVSLGNRSALERLIALRRSAVTMNREIGAAPVWNRDALTRRSTELQQMALKVFSI